ncbi:MAG: ParA family protein [Chloracidobacterium sp.]|uniref:ParA family protein n=1 Tax=Chloracidobacterium validum TaxID=2821543 RepID=A0ABX8BBT1_9BACT|nr:ParA family protein [Chloracidobacterium validum]QUW04387.1 ParA family protein [Chloracidobacterium validum]
MRVAIFNQSGGVGKTSLTRDLGYELATRGQRVLVVDADPQGTLGSFLGLEPATRPRAETFWATVCDGADAPPVVQPTAFALMLGLANRFLIGDELALMQQSDPARLLAVSEAHITDYDWVLFDCPPKISEITLQILLAADALLAPVQTEAKSVESFAEVQLEIVKAQRRRKNMRLAPLRVLGVVPTLYNPRLVLHRHHYAELTERICPSFGYHVFDPVRDYVAVSEAGTRRQPLKQYAPKCPATADVAALATAILSTLSEGR